jgi:Lecithin:cholesterol acyltransferase
VQGNIVLSYFMHRWGDDWVRRHVKEVVAVSGPWGGAVNSLKAAISGDNFGLYFSHDLLHSVQGTSPSGPWLFPSADVWRSDDVLVSTRTRNYTALDFGRLLKVRSVTASLL